MNDKIIIIRTIIDKLNNVIIWIVDEKYFIYSDDGVVYNERHNDGDDDNSDIPLYVFNVRDVLMNGKDQ